MKRATRRRGASRESATIQDSTWQGSPRWGAFGAHGPRPQRPRMWRGAGVLGGFDYWPTAEGYRQRALRATTRFSGRRERGVRRQLLSMRCPFGARTYQAAPKAFEPSPFVCPALLSPAYV
jgi:hypothetical protein